jgi:hypothetical protein
VILVNIPSLSLQIYIYIKKSPFFFIVGLIYGCYLASGMGSSQIQDYAWILVCNLSKESIIIYTNKIIRLFRKMNANLKKMLAHA